jgi:hydroxymethylglutaryl-CoA synthase
MISIHSWGVYVPFWRLDMGCVRKGLRGERAVANFDEDSLTMGVAAGVNCLKGMDRSTVDGLFFASTTFPYKEKQASVIAATALDLSSNDFLTADFGNSLRAGTTALLTAFDTVAAGRAKQILVIASDMRIPTSGSDLELVIGDGAAAFLVSASDSGICIRDTYSVADEILDVWRTDEDKVLRSWEERFNVEQGYLRILPKAVSGLLGKNSLTGSDLTRAVFYGPNKRRHAQMGKNLGLSPEQVEPSLFGLVGDTGAASTLMMLASALEKAEPGDKMIAAGYGNGSDAILIEVQGDITHRPGAGMSEYLASKGVLRDYIRYLHWRGLIDRVTGRRRPPIPSPSASCIWRERDQNIRFYASKCEKCGTVQFPPGRICIDCHVKDEMTSHRLSDRGAQLYTFVEDSATPNPDPPLVLAVVDFDGGGRASLYMTDKGDTPPEIGMRVEMTFRKLFTTEGIHNYTWKCEPVRLPEEI